MLNLAKYRVLIFFLIFFLVLGGTFAAIKFTQGYRIDFTSKKIQPTGLLVANSTPVGAEVYVNGKLLTATNNIVSLRPGNYLVEIKKTGFYPWTKNLVIEKELVTEAQAFLFFQNPELEPLTFSEVLNPQLSPEGTRLLYAVPLPLPEAGLWTMDLTDFPFNLGRQPRQIAISTLQLDFAKSAFSWSPDGKQILVDFRPFEKYLLDPGQLNDIRKLTNIADSLEELTAKWSAEAEIRQEAKLKRLPEKVKEILKTSATKIDFSPDGGKVMYLATASAEIPDKLMMPPLLATSTQPEARLIEPANFYVYDLKEDKNFLIPAVSPRWFPTGRHFYWIDPPENKVFACDYDGSNLAEIYRGPFTSPFAFAAPGANKLVVLTQFNLDKNAKPNLYSVSLR